MKNFDWRALCLCGFWMLMSGCDGTVGRSMKPLPLTITSAVPPQAALAQAYGSSSTGFFVTATGGVRPYRWTWVAAAGSSLPPGLNLSSNPDGRGVISGRPTKTGPYGVIVTVTDAESPAVQKSENYIITVAAASPSSHVVNSGTMLDKAGGPNSANDCSLVTVNARASPAISGRRWSWSPHHSEFLG